MWQKIKCWFGLHNYEIRLKPHLKEFYNLSEELMVPVTHTDPIIAYELVCKHCGRKAKR